ncbi:MAG: hypothetical protein ACJ8CR_32975 [Roseiflexaceae bacterium]
MSPSSRFRPLSVLIAVLLILSQLMSAAGSARSSTSQTSVSNHAPTQHGQPARNLFRGQSADKPNPNEAEEDDPYARDDAFYSRRTAGDHPISVAEAAALREQAAASVLATQKVSPAGIGPAAFSGAWSALGPNPIVEGSQGAAGILAMSGRATALAIRSTSPFTTYLGTMGGGVWISSTLTTEWQYKGADLTTQSIGAIMLAPSNENIIYVGTGEGNLSGDSYFGVGVYKSTDAGNHFSTTGIDNTPFKEVSISKIAVDPLNPNHLWVATLRGRGGSRRVSPPPPNPTGFGIWESSDGGAHWTQQVARIGTKGATDLVIDPTTSGASSVLYASFWTTGISKTVDAGAHWTTAMIGLPSNANYVGGATRFALGIGRKLTDIHATVYTGFDWFDTNDAYHHSTIWKSTDDAAHWAETNTDVVGGYCDQSPVSQTSQCFYDNVIGVDPTNPNIVYALGLFNYRDGSGGVYRSLDGGATWRDLGWGLHPDQHAFAVRKSDPQHIAIANDGGVWTSASRGGRPLATDPISATTWVNLNGVVNPTTGAVLGRTGLQTAEFTSIGQHPTNADRLYGGLQDNGTLIRSNTLADSGTWTDKASGDGGQVLVDPSDPNYIYGTYPNIFPYRFTDGMLGTFYPTTTNELIITGFDQNDSTDFYDPFLMDPSNPNQLYFGSDHVYRTDNAKAADSADVLWQQISPNLTSACPGSAPNGARACALSALGASPGAPALYSGSLDAQVWLTKDATVDTPAWVRVDKAPLPNRPVGAIAVDASNYLIAYVAYNGFNDATPSAHGHVFKTTDAGAHWTNVSGNLPDAPVNSLVLDPFDPQTLYAGTDVGPMVTTNGGATWATLGTGLPPLVINQINVNPFTRQLVIGSGGLGAWRLPADTAKPALHVRKHDAGVLVGQNSMLDYTITVENVGSQAASTVTISDPLPLNTSFVSASVGGAVSGGSVVWSGLTVPAATAGANGGLVPGTRVVTFRVQISGAATPGQYITNTGLRVTSAQVPAITGSPLETLISPANAVALSPASQVDGARSGQSVNYIISLHNLGTQADRYDLTTSGNAWSTTFWNASFTLQITRTGVVPSNGTTTVGVKVNIPANQPNGATDTATVKATSVGNPAKSATGTIKTLAVTRNVLLVDEDGDAPDVKSYYQDALRNAGYAYNYWDLGANPDLRISYMKAHSVIVWFTGSSYPGPITPYESELTTFLNGGGKLFMSGMDILDQDAGTTSFVHDYLHIDWDGTEAQNDIGTTSITAVPTNTVMAGLGTLPVDVPALFGDDFSDEITPIAPAVPALRDSDGGTNALTVSAGNYKVVFLAFPFEAITSSRDRTSVMSRSIKYFGLKGSFRILLPIIRK